MDSFAKSEIEVNKIFDRFKDEIRSGNAWDFRKELNYRKDLWK